MIGQSISHYPIVEKLGEGGMGEVNLAQDTGPLDRKAALKFLSQDLQEDPVAKQRFLREAIRTDPTAQPSLRLPIATSKVLLSQRGSRLRAI